MTMPSMKNLGFNDGCGETRKASKPLIEKRRRARINYSLAELKAIVVGVDKPLCSAMKPPKLEKADILEMAVAYVKKVKDKQNSTPETDQNGYLAGFNQCLLKVCQFLDKEIDDELKSRLVMHLNNTANSLSSPAVEPSNDDTSSSCSSNSRPASVTSNETSNMEYQSSSPFTDTEQDTRTFPAAESYGRSGDTRTFPTAESYGRSGDTRTFPVAESYGRSGDTRTFPVAESYGRSAEGYYHSQGSSRFARAEPGVYGDSSSSAMNGPLNLAKSPATVRRDAQSGHGNPGSQMGFFNCGNATDNCMWRPWHNS